MKKMHCIIVIITLFSIAGCASEPIKRDATKEHSNKAFEALDAEQSKSTK